MIDHNMLILGVRRLRMTRVIAVSIMSLDDQSSPVEGMVHRITNDNDSTLTGWIM